MRTLNAGLRREFYNNHVFWTTFPPAFFYSATTPPTRRLNSPTCSDTCHYVQTGTEYKEHLKINKTYNHTDGSNNARGGPI